MASTCAKLNTDFAPTCDSIKRVGGMGSFMYVCNLKDIASYTVDATSKDIETIVMESTTTLYKIEGRKAKNSGSIELQKGDSINTWMQKLNVVFYSHTSLLNTKIETFAEAEDLVFFVPDAGGYITVWGLDVNSGSISDPFGGLTAESGLMETGTEINGRKPMAITFSGELRNTERYFNIDTTPTYTANIAYLEALL